MSARTLLVAVAILGVGCVAPGPGAPGSQPPYRLSGGFTAGPLAVRRVELTFGSGRPEATVRREERVGARAVIRFAGSGPFDAAWVVDGRPVETVALMITFGDTLTLETAAPLPTFEPGPHAVTLRIHAPAGAPPAPSITYLVTADAAREAR